MMRFRFYLFPTKSSHLTASQCHTNLPTTLSVRLRQPSLLLNQHRFDSCGQIFPSSKADSLDPCNVDRQDISETDDVISSSITVYRFDDVSDQSTNRNDRVFVTDSWKLLVHRLKSIVDSFELADVALHDMTSVRKMMERYHIAKLYIKPYSYTADDILSFAPKVMSPPCLGALCWIDGSTKSEHESMESEWEKTELPAEKSKLTCLSLIQQNYINNLETESLRIAMVLSENAWWNDISTQDAFICSNLDLPCWHISARQPNVLLSVSPVLDCAKSEMGQGNKDPHGKPKGPTQDQLSAVQEYLADNLPKLFVERHNYGVYTKDVVFENSWYSDKFYSTIGVLQYALEIAKLRLYVHAKIANVKMSLLKITTHTEDGTVRVRWRVSGIPHAKAMMFWKYFSWNQKSSIATETEWMDGFSIFTVENSGLICKHKMDRVMPDEGPEIKMKTSVMEKLGLKSPMPATN